jgi:hypothetical protein
MAMTLIKVQALSPGQPRSAAHDLFRLKHRELLLSSIPAVMANELEPTVERAGEGTWQSYPPRSS